MNNKADYVCGGFVDAGRISSLETSNTNIFFGLVTLAETEWRKE